VDVSLIIFDCDGVLFDSRPANVAFYNAVLAELGLPPMDADREDMAHFMASAQLYDLLFASDPALRTRASEVSRNMDYGPFYGLMRPAEGMLELLHELRSDYALAMASNRTRTAQGVAERFRLEPFLDLVVGAHQVERPKPAPDMLELCMRELGVAPAHSLYIGDAATDRQAADAAGMHFIGVGPHSSDPQPLTQLADLRQRLHR
jgi:HAD superfamily hydrolase (TIGR01509 family)